VRFTIQHVQCLFWDLYMDLFFEDCVCVCTCVFMERSDTLVNSRPSAIPESQYGNERRVLAYAVLIKRFCLPYSYRHTYAHCLQIKQYAHTHFLDNAPAQQTMNTLISQGLSIVAVLAKNH